MAGNDSVLHVKEWYEAFVSMLTPCGHRGERQWSGSAPLQFVQATEAVQGE